MSVRASMTEGPVASASEWGGDVGAVLVFEGVVRRMEGERELAALEYEAYEPMASRMLERIAGEVAARHGLRSIRVVHSVGVVPVGRASLRVEIESAHRGPSLAAMAEFIDLLKRDVPIWKKPVWRT